MERLFIVLLFSTFWGLHSCGTKEEPFYWKELEVTVTAYNSVSSQTDGSPTVAAWGDTLKPGMKCIAVSRDLVALGIDYNTPVKIEGLEPIYLVKDKMNRRWKKRIDLYMGVDIKTAREWGKKKLKIRYRVTKDDGVEQEK